MTRYFGNWWIAFKVGRQPAIVGDSIPSRAGKHSIALENGSVAIGFGTLVVLPGPRAGGEGSLSARAKVVWVLNTIHVQMSARHD